MDSPVRFASSSASRCVSWFLMFKPILDTFYHAIYTILPYCRSTAKVDSCDLLFRAISGGLLLRPSEGELQGQPFSSMKRAPLPRANGGSPGWPRARSFSHLPDVSCSERTLW